MDSLGRLERINRSNKEEAQVAPHPYPSWRNNQAGFWEVKWSGGQAEADQTGLAVPPALATMNRVGLLGLVFSATKGKQQSPSHCSDKKSENIIYMELQ